MSLLKRLEERSSNSCELCGSTTNLDLYEEPPSSERVDEDTILICDTCSSQIEDTDAIDVNHWRCLNDSMWSEVSAVKVVAWRMLNTLQSKGEGWAQDNLGMMYMEDTTLEWAKKAIAKTVKLVHKDSNGSVLTAGDSVVLIKDLKVKGGGFTAKRGTAMRRISLNHENEKYIEGKIDGQQVVLITDYVKKL